MKALIKHKCRKCFYSAGDNTLKIKKQVVSSGKAKAHETTFFSMTKAYTAKQAVAQYLFGIKQPHFLFFGGLNVTAAFFVGTI